MSRSGFTVVLITRTHLAAFLGVCCLLAILWVGVFDKRSAPVTAPAGVRPGLPIDQPVRQVPGVQGQVALTINVDWGNDELLQMLELFERMNVRATFFLTGRWAKNFPDLARLIAEKDHEIANHGMSHDHPTQISLERLIEMIHGNVELIEEQVGVRPVPLFAPPYGEQDERVVKTAAQFGLWTTLWTYDTIDWQEPPPHVIVDRIVPRAQAGGIVLMHPKPQTVQALPDMITGLRDKGLEPVPLWQMMQATDH